MFHGVKLGVLKHYNEKDYDVKINRIPELTEDKFEVLYASCLMEVDIQKYSYMQILLDLLKIIFKLDRVKDYSEKSSVCNEFIIDRFNFVNLQIMPGRDSADTTPIETYKSKIWTKIK